MQQLHHCLYIKDIMSMFRIVVSDVFKSNFQLKMHQNDYFFSIFFFFFFTSAHQNHLKTPKEHQFDAFSEKNSLKKKL